MRKVIIFIILSFFINNNYIKAENNEKLKSQAQLLNIVAD